MVVAGEELKLGSVLLSHNAVIGDCTMCCLATNTLLKSVSALVHIGALLVGCVSGAGTLGVLVVMFCGMCSSTYAANGLGIARMRLLRPDSEQ